MLLKIACLLFCWNVYVEARLGYTVPKFYIQESAVTVDSDRETPAQIGPQFRLLPSYPMYHIIPATGQPDTTMSTPYPPSSVNNEFPNDLLEIAQEKLGLKSLDEIPSISELGELLGTSSSQETVKYIRQLTSTEQGIALMKAYIESTDYTDNNGNDADDEDVADDAAQLEQLPTELEDDDEDDETGVADDDMAGVDDEDELAARNALALRRQMQPESVDVSTTAKPGFFERMYGYLNVYNMWTGSGGAAEEQKPSIVATKTSPPEFVKHMNVEFKRPMLVRQPLPYQYPIPLRPLLVQPVRNATPTPPTLPPTPIIASHLNTPKLTFSPHMQRLIKAATNMTSKKIETLLQQKPRLAELATRVSSFPLAYERGSQMETQLLAAVQKAIEQDDELKKLLNATTATLK